LLESNSAANEWCAIKGDAGQDSAQAASSAPSTLGFIVCLPCEEILHLFSRKEKERRDGKVYKRLVDLGGRIEALGKERD
jgi:hypothetical protein